MSRPVPIVLALFGATILFGGWAAALVAIRWLAPAAATGSAPWPLATPWWVPTLLWLGTNGIALALLRRRMHPEAPQPAPISPTWRAPTPEAAPAFRMPPSLDAFIRPTRPFETIALAQDGDGAWHAAAKAATAIRKVRVFIDHAPAPGREDGRVSGPVRAELASFSDLTAGQEIAVPVLRPEDGAWRIAASDGGKLASEPMHRCRLALLADERELQSVYFVVLPLAVCTVPIVVDESVFRYKDAWEAEAPLLQMPRWRGR